MEHGLHNKAAIIGMGCTKFGERYDVSKDDMIVEAVTEAISDAGINFSDIDAFWFGTMVSDFGGTGFSTVMKSQYKPVTRVENMCCTGSDAFRNACYAVASGAYDVVMAIGVEKLKDSGYSGLVNPVVDGDHADPELNGPPMFSFLAPAYAKKYGVPPKTVREVMAKIAFKNHHNGALNPKAMYQKEVPLDKIMASPMVCAPYLSVMDCSGVSDGCACAIIARTEDAKKYRNDPVYVKATELVAGPGFNERNQSYDFTSVGETAVLAQKIYKSAGITDPLKQISLAEIHDCFTITELVLYEDLQFSERGKGWRDVLDGKFEIGGDLPVNIDGGLKAFGHPIGASGLRMMYENWLQFHGKAGARQIENPTLGLVHNLGGFPFRCLSVITLLSNKLD
jgi:acetyl-CoA C-acetyltransferase